MIPKSAMVGKLAGQKGIGKIFKQLDSVTPKVLQPRREPAMVKDFCQHELGERGDGVRSINPCRCF
jgi:hypothetical protein